MLASRARTIWIVEDSPVEAERARVALAGTYDVEVFHDGETVLGALQERSPPDVLVLDWVLPGLSALDLCRFIRSSPVRDHVAILLVTSSSRDEVSVGMGAGGNDYLAKPYDESELITRTSALVRARELSDRVEQAEETVCKLLAHTPDAMIVADAEGRAVYVNAETERLLGRSTSSLVGRPVPELVPGLVMPQLEGGKVQTLPDVTIDDEILSPLARLLPSDFGSATTIALRNVTERRNIETRRLDFYSIIAHELRSPLSSVLLRTDFILRGRRGILPAELIADIRKIESNVRSMVALINDFLDLARLEGSGYRLERENVDMAALVAATADDIRPLLEESRLTLEVDLRGGALEVVGDRRRLVQVLTNLFANAIKFTPAGGKVTVSAGASDGTIEIRVADTGRGIPADAISQLFERYRRARTASPVAGTGLGLMIVREIVEAHGGTVGVESELGKGSTFWVRLPRGAGARRAGPVLIVDDDAEVRESLRFVLEAEGYDVEVAVNGRDALDRLAHLPPPAAVFLDLSMPVISGVEVIDELRRQRRLDVAPLCVMSANLSVLPQPPENALVLQKPIPITRVLDFVVRHAKPRGMIAAAASR